MRVLVTAKITSAPGSHSVLVRDISIKGAQIYTQSLVIGSDGCFARGELFVAIHVVWFTRGGAGVQFYGQLSSQELEAVSRCPEPV